MTERPAAWIGHPAWESSDAPADALPVFRVHFHLDRPDVRAHLRITALGVYDALLNERPVGRAVLEPPHTDYAHRVVWRRYDVTALLVTGENVLTVEVGPGMAQVSPTPDRYQKLTRSDGPPRLLAQLELDGVPHLVTDAAWQTAVGRTTFSGWYGGEDHDARRALSWQPVVELGPAGPRLTESVAPPVEVVETLPTVAVTEPRPGVAVFDLGVNFAGWQQLRVHGPAGTAVVMRPGEALDADGLVVQDLDGTGGPIWDTYVLAGRGVETWHPRFRYHGMRYLQVEGLPHPPSVETVSGLVLRAANRRIGRFACSDPLLSTLHRLVDRAIQSNMFSVLTDCPHREKLGWLEQIHLVFGPIAFGYDVHDYYRELLRVVAEAQTPEGLVPDIAPEYVVFEDGFRDDPNWGGAIVLAAWLLYREYGDTATLREHYPAMVRYADYLTGLARGGLLDHGLGDWAAFDESTPRGLTATFGYLRVVDTLRAVATVLDEEADATRYAGLANQITQAFRTAYRSPEGSTYGVGNQACDALALELGVVPACERDSVIQHLVDDLVARNHRLTVGEIGLGPVLRTLAAAGRHDVIWQVVTRPGYPGFAHLSSGGATSLPEYWDGPDGHGSLNHFMLGVVDDWFVQYVAGLRAGERHGELVIGPVPVGDVTWAEAEQLTDTGPAGSAWQLADGTLSLRVQVPGGRSATVEVPLSAADDQVDPPAGAVPLERTATSAPYQVGAGTWLFTRHGGRS